MNDYKEGGLFYFFIEIRKIVSEQVKLWITASKKKEKEKMKKMKNREEIMKEGFGPILYTFTCRSFHEFSRFSFLFTASLPFPVISVFLYPYVTNQKKTIL